MEDTSQAIFPLTHIDFIRNTANGTRVSEEELYTRHKTHSLQHTRADNTWVLYGCMGPLHEAQHWEARTGLLHIYTRIPGKTTQKQINMDLLETRQAHGLHHVQNSTAL